jgi:hypothetical protein
LKLFLRVLGDFVPVLKLNFHSSNILNSLLVPVPNPKSTHSFAFGTKVQSPQEIEEKKIQEKKLISGICTGSNILILDLEKNFKNF